ncbi:uncharacterized protein LOC124658160 [Lolium rigidum]|uniref:uncharacterized protein LOC124658160 n=1 Tax=Lolium rigidum TaxID=89674 RepID=UPI001F5D358F|nr:uncharacterized protein LOC124658160 [Lolium rigidum]
MPTERNGPVSRRRGRRDVGARRHRSRPPRQRRPHPSPHLAGLEISGQGLQDEERRSTATSRCSSTRPHWMTSCTHLRCLSRARSPGGIERCGRHRDGVVFRSTREAQRLALRIPARAADSSLVRGGGP